MTGKGQGWYSHMGDEMRASLSRCLLPFKQFYRLIPCWMVQVPFFSQKEYELWREKKTNKKTWNRMSERHWIQTDAAHQGAAPAPRGLTHSPALLAAAGLAGQLAEVPLILRGQAEQRGLHHLRGHPAEEGLGAVKPGHRLGPHPSHSAPKFPKLRSWVIPSAN